MAGAGASIIQRNLFGGASERRFSLVDGSAGRVAGPIAR